jgi:hypothetical protein
MRIAASAAARIGSPAASGRIAPGREQRYRRIGSDDDFSGTREDRIDSHRAECGMQAELGGTPLSSEYASTDGIITNAIATPATASCFRSPRR